ncbi:MAG: single-stranded-DNA-specific exonuclease RecJ [Candidatus Omnitrophota bacterium]|jgi:single-stranded-DNA-specific exonuclease
MPIHKILNLAVLNSTSQEKISKDLGISKVLAQILINRGITDSAQAEKFINASLKEMHDPFSFRDMAKVVERIKRAGEKREKAMIFGDYDVDGITSVAILKNNLDKLGINAGYYLPHRVKEGYGLPKNILKIAQDGKVNLVITADCGTSNSREIEDLKRHNIDTIITDHHEPSTQDLPSAIGIINPKVKNSTYKYRELAGVGVAYKLCQALTQSKLIDELDLVTLGTIADVVPLTGENRVFVKEGLKAFSQTKRPGLKAMIENAGIKKKKFTPTFVSFILGPRLNAAGRMDSADTSLKLLMTCDEKQAQELAVILEQHNRARQRIEAKILEEAEAIINKDVNFKKHKVIVVAKEDWHQGVLGIVASKLADRFYRPAIVISLNEDICKGSGRSIKNFHLFHALGECSEFLNVFGGHAHAVGLTITRESIDGFRDSINRLAHDRLCFEDLLPSLEVDMELSLADLDEKTVTELEKLEPFGMGNREPLFYTRGLKLKGEPQSLARETIKFFVTDGVNIHQVIGFGMAGLKMSLKQADTLDLVYNARIDNWGDEPSVILEAKDIFFK